MKQTDSFDPQLLNYLSQIVQNENLQEKHRLLGEGLSGKVLEVEEFAVKVYKEDYSENKDYLMLQHLAGHSAFPKLHYADEKMMVVEKVKGATLAEIWKAGEKLDDHIYSQIETSVDDCYRQGIIAHDLHLNNIMLDEDKKVKIVDVGRFHQTGNQVVYREKLREDLEGLQYHALFGLFSSSDLKKRRKHRKYYTSSSRRKHHYSSSSRRRHRYYSSSSHYRKKRKNPFSLF